MANRIIRVDVRLRSLDPAAAELWLSIHLERETPDAEVRGRWSGPRCRYASTIEVAYPLRPVPRPPEGLTGILRRVTVPEPSFWEPESPFLYHGQIELWEHEQLIDRVDLTRGLRTVRLGSQGIHLNGKPFLRHVARRDQVNEEAAALRAAGVNVLLVPVRGETLNSWDLADRLGFFVLGSIDSDEALQRALSVAEQPSFLACVIDEKVWHDDVRRETLTASLRRHPGLMTIPTPEVLEWIQT